MSSPHLLDRVAFSLGVGTSTHGPSTQTRGHGQDTPQRTNVPKLREVRGIHKTGRPYAVTEKGSPLARELETSID